MADSKSRIAYRISRIAYRISRIAYRISRIAYRVSRIAITKYASLITHHETIRYSLSAIRYMPFAIRYLPFAIRYLPFAICHSPFAICHSPSATMPPAIHLLSIPVHNVTFVETIEIIDSFIQEKTAHQICTVNPEFVMAAQSDDEFRSILQNADLCLPDGVGIVWAAKWLKSPLRERVTGSDLVPMIAREAASRGWKLFFLGAEEGVADRAAQILRARHPELKVVGARAGSPHINDDDESIRLIRQAQPDILFVAYGAPAQDKWIQRNRSRVGVPVLMGVGGSFDFISGVAARAPRWIQNIGLEWLHRLIQQPWRWKRMLALPRFVAAVLFYKLPKS